MRAYFKEKLPNLQSQLYRPPDNDENSETHGSETEVDEEAEQRLSAAFDRGGITEWASQAYRELERERQHTQGKQ